MTEFISVFIPTYNAERFVGRAIESVLTQSYPHFELIVIDNASTDKTPELIKKYTRLDSRVRFLQNDTNIGFQRSVNRALLESRYEYVAKVDAPDWMPPYRLEEQKAFLDNHECVAVVGGDCAFFDEMYNYTHSVVLSDYYLPVDLLFSCYISHSAVMYRKSVVMLYGGYDERFVRGEDYDLWTKILADGYCLENMSRVMSCELIFKGQGADFYKREEWDTVKQAQLRTLRAIIKDPVSPNAVETVLGLAKDTLNCRISSDEVYEVTRYFCKNFFADLQAFYPYNLKPEAKYRLLDRLRTFIIANMFNSSGWAALQAVRDEDTDMSLASIFKDLRPALRRSLRNIYRKIKYRSEDL